jgi:cellulose synthase/poly-beta-1,6-N-acetylglucosamine synthase-like glycosyltransferase
MELIRICFWLSVFLIMYPSIIYPSLVGLLAFIRPRPLKRRSRLPSVTVLIPAHNEAQHIAATIQNKLEQDYPRDRLEIIVISDGSTDGTDDIVREFSSQNVRLIRREKREGKAAGLNESVRHARGEILVFSDANSLFAPDAIRRMMENFADPEIGYVTGNLAYKTRNAGVAGNGCSAYMKYENALRKLETRAGSIIGVNGGVDAIRRELYKDVPRQLITDFVLPLHVISTKHRVVYDERAHSFEVPNSELGSESRMRIRVALRALQGIAYMRRLCNPVRYPWAAFGLISHKIIRYLGFLFLPIAFVSNLMLASTPAYAVLFIAQSIVYLLALVGWRKGLPSFFRNLTLIPTYFLMTNVAFAVAAIKFLQGETMATWQPRAGAQPVHSYNRAALSKDRWSAEMATRSKA